MSIASIRRPGGPKAAVPVPGGPCLGGAYAFGALYAATCYNDEGLVRIDPERLEVTDQIPLPTPDLYQQEGSIAAGEGAVWLVIDGKGCEACVLAGFDPETLKMTHEVELDPGAASVAARQRLRLGQRLKAQPGAADRPEHRRESSARPRSAACPSTWPWIPTASGCSTSSEGNVTQLDPATGEVLATIEADMAGAGGSITVGDGSVWVRGTLDAAEADRLGDRGDRRRVRTR